MPRDHVVQPVALPELALSCRPHWRDGRVVTHVGALPGSVEAGGEEPLRVLAPVGVVRLRLHRGPEVKVLRVGVRLRARVRQVPGEVQALGHVHRRLRPDPELGAGHLEHRYSVERLRPRLPVLLLRNVDQLGWGLVLAYHLQERRGDGLVENMAPLPLQGQFPVCLGHDDVNGVVGLRLEAIYLVPPLHAEPECWRLARPVGDKVRIQVPVLPLEVLRLKPCEGTAELKVHLAPGVHGIGHVLVG
mmetsp:Transcript_102879/g.291359  ORF Transcript_102879/g.291359 Transcript_102879/m.291359 type:complete len:246 (-) Transcript_102879:637-1374(-)